MPKLWEAHPDFNLLEDTFDGSLQIVSVVSEDVWKKFGLDEPISTYTDQLDEETVLFDDIKEVTASTEIRHHDCMWAGLCISQEHNRTLPATKSSQSQEKIPAGRSLLISRPSMTPQKQQQQTIQQQYSEKSSIYDGNSPRPETPPTSTSDTDSDEEVPLFKHDQINIHEKISECITDSVTKAAPVSTVTNQLVRRFKRKREEENSVQPNLKTTLSDHSYHLNHPDHKKIECLGIQTPSESEEEEEEEEEEEIDVVTFEKPSQEEQQQQLQYHFQEYLQKQRSQQRLQRSSNVKEKRSATAATTQTPKPRGRPPANSTKRKRKVAANAVAANNKKKCTRNTQRRKMTKNIKDGVGSKSSSEDEVDTEKRSLHNNMERRRRVELRHHFERLRCLVPAIQNKEKAAKVTILNQATTYCKTLQREYTAYTHERSYLKEKQINLRNQLKKLRSNYAKSRHLESQMKTEEGN
ncbi:transcriptional regulator Myc-A-like [Polistes fuscatus]|uniref:transcriptional regulator Myc-A-like n=1 Tax=Polistes fuscatus TaxID=30207 RepID=UPI001CA9E468|nr:transcriptional regulator Myc-A-like [Polistes fuscatus]